VSSDVFVAPMKVFHCDHCGSLVFFENTHCVSCGHLLAFLPDLLVLGSLDPVETSDLLWRSPLPAAAGRTYRLCANYRDAQVCNWSVDADDDNPLCRSCRLTRVIPDQGVEGNQLAWYRLEVAKRRLLYTLLSLHLPIEGQDDTAAMYEVVHRRFLRYADERARGAAQEEAEPGTERRRFAYPPNLVVVDGGLPQVNAAKSVLDELGIEDVSLVGLAKRLEEVWVPGQNFPLILPRTSEGLYLLQRVRDEAHRFAITFHRQRRSKAMTTSDLDGIPGLGEVRRKALLRVFGSVKRLRAASVEEIAAVQGIGPVLADTIATRLARDSSAAVPAVNVTTGEVLD